MAAILAIPTSSSENAARRYLGVTAVGSLHIAAIYVLLTALNIIPSPIPNPDVQFHWLPPDRSTKVDHPIPPVGRPNTMFARPDKPIAHEPVIKTAEPTPNPLPLPQNPGTTEGTRTLPPPGLMTSARAVAGTHMIPRYPMIALRLGYEGDVRLRLIIDEHGNVIAADLLTASGHDELDAAAIAWVKAHWRYTPAMQSGNPVQSSVSVTVTFRLDQAR
jgi:protein TonB